MILKMENVVVLIPAYEPEKNFLKFLDELKKEFKNIVVVNDGSGKKYKDIFNEIKNKDIIVIENFINMGKGRALKNGINYILQNYNEDSVIVTADSDGQHLVNDIKLCEKKCLEKPERLILGSRNFNEDNVPIKSKFGNKLTSSMFKLFIGLNINDTQTGLRAFSCRNAKEFLKIEGERFEYETNVLIATKKLRIPIEEVKIATVYINENKSTHFNPLKDSLNIYKLFFKYIMSSLSSFIIDIVFFTLFYNILFGVFDKEAILISTIIARIISSLYNCFINSKIVFEQEKLRKNQFIKYYILVIIQMLVSAFSVYIIDNIINFNATVVKIIIDSIIFVVNFYVQREWVFKERK